MTKYSRTQKYEDLRNHLTNEPDSDIHTKELSDYEKRLNRISSENFEEPKEYSAEDHDPIHARRRSSFEAPKKEEPAPSTNTNDVDYSFLNDYINEVKQYNIDQGNAFSTNTDMNILKSIRGEKPAPKKPFPNEVDEEPTNAYVQTPKLNPEQVRSVKQETMPPIEPAAKPLGSKPMGATETIDIPFLSDDTATNNDFMDLNSSYGDINHTQSMTKEDIANEVQNLIRQPDPARQFTSNTSDTNTNSFMYPTSDPARFDTERATRQQLLNETTQMRAQLDDYEENLTDVSEKMQHTNKILNFVLIILIIAMLVVLAVVIYWILSSKGIL